MPIDSEKLIADYEMDRQGLIRRTKIILVCVVLLGSALGGWNSWNKYNLERPRTDEEFMALAKDKVDNAEIHSLVSFVESEYFRTSRPEWVKDQLLRAVSYKFSSVDKRKFFIGFAEQLNQKGDSATGSKLARQMLSDDKVIFEQAALSEKGIDPSTILVNCSQDIELITLTERSVAEQALYCWLQAAQGITTSLPTSYPSKLDDDSNGLYWSAYITSDKSAPRLNIKAKNFKDFFSTIAVALAMAKSERTDEAIEFADRANEINKNSKLAKAVQAAIMSHRTQALADAEADIRSEINSLFVAHSSSEYTEKDLWGGLSERVTSNFKTYAEGKAAAQTKEGLAKVNFSDSCPVAITTISISPYTQGTLTTHDDTAICEFDFSTEQGIYFDRAHGKIYWERYGSSMKITKIYWSNQRQSLPTTSTTVPFESDPTSSSLR